MDTKHPTNQFLLCFVLPLFVGALCVIISLWLSGDIYTLNCTLDCHSFDNIMRYMELNILPTNITNYYE